MTTSISHRLRNIIYGVCFGLFLGYLATDYISWTIGDKGPLPTPDPAHGVIYPNNDHGVIMYYPAVQALTDHIPFWLPPIAFLGLLIAPKKDVKPKFFGINWINDDPDRIGATTIFVAMAVVVASLFLAGSQIMDFLVANGIKSLPYH